jgi:serine/threonine-protein kinase
MGSKKEPGIGAPHDETVVRGPRAPQGKPAPGGAPGERAPHEQTVNRRPRSSVVKRRSLLDSEDAGAVAADEYRSGTDAGRGAGGSRSAGSTMDGTAVVLREVIRVEEGARAHGFSGLIALVIVAISPLLPILGGDPLVKRLAFVALSIMCLVSLWVWYVTREPARYTKTLHRFYGWILVTGVLFVEYYIGFFSAVSVVVTLGIYYFGQSNDRIYSYFIPAYAIGSYALMASLMTAGIVVDRSLFSAEYVPIPTRVFAIFGVSTVLLLTLWMARIARTAMKEAIKRSNEALLMAQKREALLAEARNQLDHALRLAIGKPGRHTGEKAGPYRLDVVLGMGAMGVVYEAEHQQTGEKAAVKLLQADPENDEYLLERFARERDISRQLRHPNLVRVFDVGQLDDGAPYIAMELLIGEDLAARLRREGSLPVPDVVKLAEETAEGIQYAHEAGVIHRDLKPHNIFLTRDGRGAQRWKILDFGISKLRTSDATLTHEAIVGTPSYMSPEQAKGVAVDHRSDLFSMASVLYRALTGRPAFSGPNTPQILFDVVYRNPDRPSFGIQGLSRDIEYVLAIGLAKDPDKRFQNAIEFASALKAASVRRLDPRLRAHAERILRRYPWAQPNAPGEGTEHRESRRIQNV